jgi:DNA polymerase-3 subunit delta
MPKNRMILLISGQDTYRSIKRLKEVIEKKKESSKGLSLNVIEKENLREKDFNFQNLLSGASQQSIFEKERLMVFKNILSEKDFKEKVLENFNQLSKSNVIFYQEGKVLKSDPLFKKIKDKEEINLLKDEELEKWILRNYNIKIKREALKKIINSIGNDLWRMSNELEKLINFKKEEINIEDINLIIEPKTEVAVFKTIDAIARGDKKEALKLIHDHLKKGDSPFYLLSMINYQFRNIVNVKDMFLRKRSYGEIVKKTGLHPFVVKKSLSLSKKFKMEELKKIYRRIFQTDLSVKIGKIEPEFSLDFLISSI